MAVYLILARAVKNKIQLFEYVFLTYGFASLSLSVLLFSSSDKLSGFIFTQEVLLIFFLLALGPQVVGHTIIISITRKVSATLVSLAIVCEPIGAAVLGYMFFCERVGGVHLMSFILLIFGVFLASKN